MYNQNPSLNEGRICNKRDEESRTGVTKRTRRMHAMQ
jgi:hypothetical protein